MKSLLWAAAGYRPPVRLLRLTRLLRLLFDVFVFRDVFRVTLYDRDACLDLTYFLAEGRASAEGISANSTAVTAIQTAMNARTIAFEMRETAFVLMAQLLEKEDRSLGSSSIQGRNNSNAGPIILENKRTKQKQGIQLSKK